jgi:type I restriction enzyme S subunit
VSRTVPVTPGASYRTIGVKLLGEGAYERQTIDGADTAAKTLSVVREGDLIINKIWVRHGSTAIATTAVDGCAASGEFPTFELDTGKVLPRWLHWQTKMAAFWEKCDRLSRGTSGKNRITPAQFLTITVPLPPLSEQQRVVARIEVLAAKIQETYNHVQCAQEEVKVLLSAAQAEVFQKAARHGEVRLDGVASLERGRFSHRPRNDPHFFGGSHPWIQIAEIERSGKYIRNWSETLNDEGLRISRKFPRGTLLLSIAATIGSVGILDFDCCIPDSIVAVTPKPGISIEFLYYYLNYLRADLEHRAPQSAQKNINLALLVTLPVPVLTEHVQHQIVHYLDDLYEKVDVLQGIHAESASTTPLVSGTLEYEQ